MKIACLADQHGYLPEDIPEADVLVIAGDICPATDHSHEFQLDWLQNKFVPWADDLSKVIEDIVVIAGNHDWAFEVLGRVGEFLQRDVDGLTYLQGFGLELEDHDDESKSVKIYGTPYTPAFCNWAFNSSREALRRHTAAIPDDADVVITHGPPQDILDLPGPPHEPQHCGCAYLAQRIQEIKPQAHIFGHIHGARGIKEINGTQYVNASYVDESYAPWKDPIQVIEVCPKSSN